MSVSVKCRVHFWVISLYKREGKSYSRVDNTNTTLEAILEGTLSSATSKDLSLDDKILRALETVVCQN